MGKDWFLMGIVFFLEGKKRVKRDISTHSPLYTWTSLHLAYFFSPSHALISSCQSTHFDQVVSQVKMFPTPCLSFFSLPIFTLSLHFPLAVAMSIVSDKKRLDINFVHCPLV